MILYAIQNKATGKFLSHFNSKVMPALYQTEGIAKGAFTKRIGTGLAQHDWQIVEVKIVVTNDTIV